MTRQVWALAGPRSQGLGYHVGGSLSAFPSSGILSGIFSIKFCPLAPLGSCNSLGTFSKKASMGAVPAGQPAAAVVPTQGSVREVRSEKYAPPGVCFLFEISSHFLLLLPGRLEGFSERETEAWDEKYHLL